MIHLTGPTLALCILTAYALGGGTLGAFIAIAAKHLLRPVTRCERCKHEIFPVLVSAQEEAMAAVSNHRRTIVLCQDCDPGSHRWAGFHDDGTEKEPDVAGEPEPIAS